MRALEAKINGKLIFIGLFSLILTVAMAGWVFHSAFEEQVERDVRLIAANIATAYAELDAPAELAPYAVGDLRLTLISPNGTVLFDSREEGLSESHLDRPEVQQALADGSGESVRRSDTMGYYMYYYAERLADGNLLRVAASVEDMYSGFKSVLPPVVGLAVLIMALSVVVSVFFTRRLVAPINDMAENIAEIDRKVPYRELEPFAIAIKDQQLRMEAAGRMRQDFTANVSHELKTPLTSISGYAEMIENGMAQPADIPDFAAKIHLEAGRLINLIGDIIRLSELDSMDFRSELETFDLLELAVQTVDTLSFAAERRQITIVAAGEACSLRADRDMLAELIYNLSDNAIRYNKPGGHVHVTVFAKGETAVLKVADNGIGIPDQYINRIFERFYRVDKSRSKETGGTGLGLAIVKHIALHHQAHITVDSEVEVGTTITVEIPRRLTDEQPKKRRPRPS